MSKENTTTKPKKKIKLIKDYRAVRQQSGLNQSDFWGRLGVKQSTGSRYENWREIPAATAILAHLAYVKGDPIDVRDYE